MAPTKNTITPFDLSVTALQARARVNRFLLSQVGSLFCAGEPDLDLEKRIWRVPILMVTPGFVAGQVGEAAVDALTREISLGTPLEQLYLAADELRERHHAQIKAAFIQAKRR